MSRAFGQALQTAGAGLFQITQSQGANKLQEVNMSIEQNRQAMLDQIRNSTSMLEGMQSIEASKLAREKFQFTKDEATRVAELPDWDKMKRTVKELRLVKTRELNSITGLWEEKTEEKMVDVGTEFIWVDKKTLGTDALSAMIVDKDGKFVPAGGSLNERVIDKTGDAVETGRVEFPADVSQDDTLGREGPHFKTRAEARKHFLAEYRKQFPNAKEPSAKFVDAEIDRAINSNEEGAWSIGSALPKIDRGTTTKVVTGPVTEKDVNSVANAEAKRAELGEVQTGRTTSRNTAKAKAISDANKAIEDAKERDPVYLVPRLKEEKAKIEASLATKGPVRGGGARQSQLARLAEINEQLAKLEPLLPYGVTDEVVGSDAEFPPMDQEQPLPEARQFMPDDGMGANISPSGEFTPVAPDPSSGQALAEQRAYMNETGATRKEAYLWWMTKEEGTPNIIEGAQTVPVDVPVYPEQRGHNVIGYGPGGLGDIPPRQTGLITQQADVPTPSTGTDWTKVRASERPGYVADVSPYADSAITKMFRGEGQEGLVPQVDIAPDASSGKALAEQRAYMKELGATRKEAYDWWLTKQWTQSLRETEVDPAMESALSPEAQDAIRNVPEGLIVSDEASEGDAAIEKSLSEWGASIGSMKSKGLDDAEIRQILMKTLTQLSMGLQDENGEFKPGTALSKDHPLVQSLGMILQETNFDSF